MKILFVGVFDANKQSTNTSQLLAFKKLGHDVVGYNYRAKAMLLGNEERDVDLIEVIENRKFDLVLFSKCNVVGYEVFKRATAATKTCLWFMDPLISYNDEMRQKTKLVSYVCCDKINVLHAAKELNKNSFHVCEGFDHEVDKPHDLEKNYKISFIGNIYGNRQEMINSISEKVHTFNNAYGTEHAKCVSKTLINLNFCTDNGASDRIYKIMAAKGFLLTDDWKGRDLVDGEHCVVFKNAQDLNSKIKYYLQNPSEANKISLAGYNYVQKYSRLNWAKKIVEYSNVI